MPSRASLLKRLFLRNRQNYYHQPGLTIIIGILIVLLAGIAMMINTNWGWGHFWITAGLVGFASTFVTGVAVLGPRSHRVDELIRTVGVEAAETQAAIRQLLLIARFDVAVLLLVIVDMVVKPFST